MISIKPLIAYSIADSAMDLIAMGENGSRYMNSRDPSLVKAVAGKKLTEFTVNRIDSDAYSAFVDTRSTLPEQRRAAFQLAVSSIKNMIDNKTGQLIPELVPSDRRQVYGNLIPSLSEEDMRRVPPAYIREIGEVARMRSDLPLGSADSYHPPALLRHVFAARLASQGAEQIAAARLRESSRKSTKPTAKRTAKSGAKATAATATAKAKKRRAPAKRRQKEPSK